MKVFKITAAKAAFAKSILTERGTLGRYRLIELPDEHARLISGGIAESPPPAHDTLVRPGDIKGIAL